MIKEEKPKQLIPMSTVVASGITAIVAALFTSRLGVTGTLIGTAMTPMLMTIGVAVLNAPIQKATGKISDLPSTVRGHLSTQRVLIPGAPRPEDAPETPEEPPATADRRRDRRSPGAFDRLRSIPTYLKEMTPAVRQKVLLTGVLAGLVAAAIGLVGVTGVEAASGSNLSCSVWGKGCGSSTVTSGSYTARPSLVQAFSGSGSAADQYAPSDSGEQPGDVQQPNARPAAPDANETPQNGQYEGSPQSGGKAPSEEAPQESPAAPAQPQDPPEAAPRDGSQQPPAAPGADQLPATPPSGQQ